MDILSVISALLDYPEQNLFEHEADINRLITEAPIEEGQKLKLLAFVRNKLDQDLLEWQSDYDALFERGRSLGLWLFEHVHGESRDRGQAMVDLSEKYQQAGLQIAQHQLPDYIPMFLEFLGTQGERNAKEWLLDVEHILALLLCRLERRESDYALLFEVLLSIAGSTLSLEDVRSQVGKEKRDDSKKAIDKEWEEEEVTFGAGSLDSTCDGATRRPSQSQRKDQDVPLNWVGFNQPDQTSKSLGASEGVAQ